MNGGKRGAATRGPLSSTVDCHALPSVGGEIPERERSVDRVLQKSPEFSPPPELLDIRSGEEGRRL
jgi:hypothetical protein